MLLRLADGVDARLSFIEKLAAFLEEAGNALTVVARVLVQTVKYVYHVRRGGAVLAGVHDGFEPSRVLGNEVLFSLLQRLYIELLRARKNLQLRAPLESQYKARLV